jgi:hypothetical protein
MSAFSKPTKTMRADAWTQRITLLIAAKNSDMMDRLGEKLRGKIKRADKVLAEAGSEMLSLARQLSENGVAMGRLNLDHLTRPNGQVAAWAEAVQVRAQKVSFGWWRGRFRCSCCLPPPSFLLDSFHSKMLGSRNSSSESKKLQAARQLLRYELFRRRGLASHTADAEGDDAASMAPLQQISALPSGLAHVAGEAELYTTVGWVAESSTKKALFCVFHFFS